MLSLESFFQEPKEFVVGAITSVRLEEREYGTRLVVEVTPLGETAPRMIFFSASTNRRSRWQRFLRDLRGIGLMPSSEKDLIGKTISFELIEEVFHIDGTEQRSDYWKPRKLFASEAEALAELANIGAVPASTPAASAKPAKPSIPKDVLDSAKALFENLKGDEAVFRIVAAQSWPNIPVDDLIANLRA